jgi:hypothetical protein
MDTAISTPGSFPASAECESPGGGHDHNQIKAGRSGLEKCSGWRLGGAGDWKARETGRRWRLAGAGDWNARETGRRWRMEGLEGAGDWQALETGRRWGLIGAGNWKAPETAPVP